VIAGAISLATIVTHAPSPQHRARRLTPIEPSAMLPRPDREGSMRVVGQSGFAVALTGALLGQSGCGHRNNAFDPLPECKGTAVTAFKGDRQLVVASLAIADFRDGFDLDGDGHTDNKLAALGAVGNAPIEDSYTKLHDIIVPLELFGYMGEANTTCTKLAFYVGKFNKDRDGDMADTNGDHGDCLDTDPAVNRNATEDLTNRLDDDCDGYADNATKGSRPSDTMDLDGDGYSLAQGDCDDRADTPAHKALAATRHPGAKDVCDDGIDQDCDGLPDNDPSCDPFTTNDMTVQIQKSSLDTAGNPLITFTNGKVTGNQLSAGPGLFSVSVPFRAGTNLDLKLNGVRISGTLEEDFAAKTTSLKDGLLGGVLGVIALASVKGIDGGGLIKPEQTLLDAVFAGALANILGLDQDKDQHYIPDMDVDGDGLESFWQESPGPNGLMVVDTCKDGDGTIIHNNFDGQGTSCVLAKDKKGNYRFVDGLSLALKFTAVPAKLGDVIQ
jgi:hypothetical protein